VTIGRTLVRLAGWLLTPLVAWAASFLGAWFGALISGGASSSRTTLYLTVLFGALAALVSAWAWLRYLRLHPRLQRTLEVTEEGTPLAAIVDETPGEVPR
jgi:hypothetical protein